MSLFVCPDLAFGQLARMVALGSSTTAGYGVPSDSSWVARFNQYYKNQLRVIDNTYNLGVGGNTMYSAMPSSFVNTIRNIQPDPNVNVTKANKLLGGLPDPAKGVVIVNFPSNGYDYMSVNEVINALQVIYDSAVRTGNKCFVTTTQPRTSWPFGTPAVKRKLVQLKDAIIARFGPSNTLNFFDGMYNPADTSILVIYSLGDGTHFNSAGHRELFRRVAAKNIFGLQVPAEGDFKSKVADGSWTAPSSWLKWNGLSWIAANGVPSTQNVSIALGHRIVLTAPTVLSGNLQVDGTLDAKSFEIDLKGNLISNGSLANLGKFSFTGTSAQTVSGTVPVLFQDVLIANTAGVLINANQTIAGTLSLSPNARLDADGVNDSAVFTFLSTSDSPANDASIAALPAGAGISGKVTVQRFMSLEGTSYRIYRNISSPVQQATVSDLQNEIPISGSFVGASTCAGCTTAPSMFWYNEAQLSHIDLTSGYVPFPTSSNNETLSSGKGYSIYVRGNLLTSAKWDLRGNVVHANNMRFLFPVTYTQTAKPDNDGWNLVGNPFVSAIDWESSGWTKTNVDASIYFKDNGTQPPRYATWNGVIGTNGGNPIISIGQGFWVKANATNPQLTANENVKTESEATFFRSAAPENFLKISLGTSGFHDEAVIHFRNDATALFDAHADAWKLLNDGINVSSYSAAAELLSINSWGKLRCNTRFFLNTRFDKPGSFTIKLEGGESFPSDVQIQFVDLKEDKKILISNQFSYAFQVLDPGGDQKRFAIDFLTPNDVVEIQLVGNQLQVNETGKIDWYYNGMQLKGEHSNHLMPSQPGTYAIEVASNGCRIRGEIEYALTSAGEIGSFAVYPNPAQNTVTVTNPGSEEINLRVCDTKGYLISSYTISGSTPFEIDVSNLNPGVYVFCFSGQLNTAFKRVIIR